MRRAALLATVLLAALAVAGCLGSGNEPGPNPQAADGDAQARADGLLLNLERDRGTIAPGESVHVNASVTNEGDSAVAYREGCRHEWNVAVREKGGGEVNWTRPVATCSGFSWREFAAGETLPFPHVSGARPFQWNGTVWDGDESRWVDAPDGDYALQIGFEYTPDGSEKSSQLEEIAAAVTVTVDGSG